MSTQTDRPEIVQTLPVTDDPATVKAVIDAARFHGRQVHLRMNEATVRTIRSMGGLDTMAMRMLSTPWTLLGVPVVVDHTVADGTAQVAR